MLGNVSPFSGLFTKGACILIILSEQQQQIPSRVLDYLRFRRARTCFCLLRSTTIHRDPRTVGTRKLPLPQPLGVRVF